MFFILSKIFAALFLPVTLFFLFLLFVFARRLSGRLRRVCLAVWLVAWFFSTSFGSALLMRPLESRYATVAAHDLAKADVVVVLGGMIDANSLRGGRPEFGSAVDRLTASLEIIIRKKADFILVSGGSGLMLQGGLREGDVLRQYLAAQGFPGEKILSEAVSRNTRENAVESGKIIAARKLQKVVLVTSALHMLRQWRAFAKQARGIPYPSITAQQSAKLAPESFFPSAQGIDDFSTAMREIVGLIAYKLSGYI
ncbi:MAG: YdcF family protein [Turneriella sp.]